MAIYELDGSAPRIDESAWVADSAQVMGNVELAAGASIWFGAIVRGDTEVIRVGRNSNIQDGSVLHADHGKPLTIGDDVTVGHKVMLHGCLVGAGALVTEGKEFPDGSMIVGSPARVVKQLTPEQLGHLRLSALHYVENARRFRAGLKKIG